MSFLHRRAVSQISQEKRRIPPSFTAHNSSSACAKKKSTKLFSKAHGKSATKAELRGERETRPQFSEREERRPENLGHKLSFAPIPGLDPPSPSFRLPSLAHGAQNNSAAPEKLGNEVAVHGTSRTRRVSHPSFEELRAVCYLLKEGLARPRGCLLACALFQCAQRSISLSVASYSFSSRARKEVQRSTDDDDVLRTRIGNSLYSTEF